MDALVFKIEIMLLRVSITALYIFLLSFVGRTQVTSVYVSPHGDDWQLFMMPNAYHSIKNEEEKVIFLQTTAADAATGPGGEHPFYLAREEGSMRAIRFVSNTFNTGADHGADMNMEAVEINGHDIAKATYRNTVSYFLRIPDGNVDGSGYPMYNHECIEKLYNGEVENLSAIDSSTTYLSKDDLINTIEEIVRKESGSSEHFVFHIADTNFEINPGDHSDHIYSSKILQDIAPRFENVTLKYYTGYYTSQLEQNVFDHDYMVSVGAWAVTASGLSDFYHNSTWDDSHNQWLGRQYFRTEHFGEILPYNVALNKPTSASNNEIGHPSAYAVDNNFSNWWGGAPYAQWWQVNLQDTFEISSINVIKYYDGTRYYQYDILASLDGTTWTKIVDYSDNIEAANKDGKTFEIEKILAKYLRVNMKFNSENPGVHIIEFQAFGVPKSVVTSAKQMAANNSENTDILLYPNPVTIGNPIMLELFQAASVNAKIEVFSVQGIKLHEQVIQLHAGNNRISLSNHKLKKGMNFVKLSYPNFSKTVKCIAN